jgi:hypothetical protein
MGTGFEICAERGGCHLKLKLCGAFDEDSANSLIEFLQENGTGASETIIETGDLGSVEPSGTDVFQKGLHGLKDLCYRLIFHGKHAPDLAPAWVDYF